MALDKDWPLPANLRHVPPLQVRLAFQPLGEHHLDHYLVESARPITREDLENVGLEDIEGITYLGRTHMGAEAPSQITARPEGPYWTVVTQRVRVRTMSELFSELRQELGGANGAVKGILNEMAEGLFGPEEEAL